MERGLAYSCFPNKPATTDTCALRHVLPNIGHPRGQPPTPKQVLGLQKGRGQGSGDLGSHSITEAGEESLTDLWELALREPIPL